MYRIKELLFCIMLLFPVVLNAQELPPLPQDGSIAAGQLQNGISYYLAVNTKYTGLADFALLIKGRPDSSEVRQSLSSLPHFNTTAPYKFLARKGIGCRQEGYISYPDGGATLYRFDDVPVLDQASSDSTLLMIFDIICKYHYQCAIIISGDINVGNLVNRMSVFSMSVPNRAPAYSKEPYAWTPSAAMEFGFTPSPSTAVTLDLKSLRTPDNMMNTIQPFISDAYVTALEMIMKDRIMETAVARNIPVRSVSGEYVNSSMTSGDEHLRFRLETYPGQMVQASACLASVASELSVNGVTKAEYKSAIAMTYNHFIEAQDNSDMIERCVSACLYGSDLATMASKLQYINTRTLNPDVEVELFNNFIKAFLNNPQNMKICWTGDEDECDDWTRETAFKSTWDAVASADNLHYPWIVSDADTLMIGKKKSSTKLKTSAPDPISGGEMWTFANGLRVIYKKTPAPAREFSYSMLINGGFSTVRDLSCGEGAFFSDMLWLYDIAGMSGVDFQKVLKANKVDMNAQVSLSDMRIYGSAPSDKFRLVIKSLVSVANDRVLNTEAFERYKKVRKAHLQTSVLDSLMYPGYKYSMTKSVSGLVDKTQQDADDYFEKEFIKINDGVLVLYGDISKEAVQKILESYLGSFRTSKIVPGRPAVQYKYRQGSVSYSEVGDNNRIEIGLVAAVPFSMENNIAFLIGCLQMQQALSGIMAENGFSVQMQQSMKLYPMESFEVVFTCLPVPECGLPAGVESGEEHLQKAANVAKKAIDDILATPIDAGQLAACKTRITNQYAIHLATPGRFIDSVLMRFSYGKDVISDYGGRINNTSPEKVNQVKSALAEGMKIQYVVR